VAMVYFAARRDAPFTALALGLALATKATAYLFAPPLLAAVLLCGRSERRTSLPMLGFLAGGVLLVNIPQYLRNLSLSGSPLSYDSVHGDGVFRWRNEQTGWKPVVSNVLRDSSDQLGAPSARWNQAVFQTAGASTAHSGSIPRIPIPRGVTPTTNHLATPRTTKPMPITVGTC